MAAEFSRELSVKVHAGLCRVSAQGFRVGGPLSYALRRELVDENRLSKGYLRRGQQKNLKTDRLVLRLGPPEEVEVIQRIFREYVDERHSAKEIARRLNREGVANHRRRPWTRMMINYILRNENYIGNTVYNRQSFRLGMRRVSNPPEKWVRSKGVILAAVDRAVFLRAQRRLNLRWEHLTDGELLQRLKLLLEKEGRLSETLINDTLGVPSIKVFCNRFGSLRNAYRRIGYRQNWNADWIDRKDEFNSIIGKTAADLIAGLGKAGIGRTFRSRNRYVDRQQKHHLPSTRAILDWSRPKAYIRTVNRRIVMPNGLILAIRLDEENRNALDYFLIPTGENEEQQNPLHGSRVAPL